MLRAMPGGTSLYGRIVMLYGVLLSPSDTWLVDTKRLKGYCRPFMEIVLRLLWVVLRGIGYRM